MFDVGFTELLLIGVVSLVVIGPERLPDVARTVGRWIGKMQRFVRGVKHDINTELESGDLKRLIGDQRKQIDELKGLVNTTRREFESSTREVVSGAKKTLGELESTVREDKSTASPSADPNRDDTSALPSSASDESHRSEPSMPGQGQDNAPAGGPETAADQQTRGRAPDSSTG